MVSIVNVTVIFIYILLIIGAVSLLLQNYICDNHNCTIFNQCSDLPKSDKITYLLDNLCQDGLFAFIASSILAGLIFAVVSVEINLRHFIIIFVLSFLLFYCMIAFLLHHYIVPIKEYIKKHL
jgi:ammonia channel protein AmtB